MTDEEKAKEWVRTNSGYSTKEFHGQKAIEAFLAGLEYNNKQIARLEKEKCELLGIIQGKDKVIQELKKELNNMLVSKSQQFTKAKELIEELSSSLSVVGECEEEECELLDRAEEFLRKSE